MTAVKSHTLKDRPQDADTRFGCPGRDPQGQFVTNRGGNADNADGHVGDDGTITLSTAMKVKAAKTSVAATGMMALTVMMATTMKTMQ